ncbi:MAG: DMT family transporter [bacterium]
MKNKGIYFALAAAAISGFAVFLNKFAGKSFGDSGVFTTWKNIPVAILFLGIMFLPKFFKELKTLNRKQWAYLLLIGAIGGSIPFLMFFKGLTLTSAVSAAFIQKTLFIWVGLLAFFFLKEKLGRMQVLAFGLLFFGNVALGGFNGWKFGAGEALVFGATLLWSVEYILAKKVLADMSPEIVCWARMFFGSAILVLFLIATGRGGEILALNLIQVKWILISSALLFGYVFSWYKTLKLESASLAACFLVPASLLTTLLNSVFVTGRYSVWQVVASLFFASALVLFYKFKQPLSFPSLSPRRRGPIRESSNI